MVGILPDDGEGHAALLAYVSERKVERLGLALHWLYQAFKEEAEEKREAFVRLHREGRYTRLFCSMMAEYTPKPPEMEIGPDGNEVEEEDDSEEADGELLKTFLLSAPSLPYAEVANAVRALCLRGSLKHLTAGLSVLRELVTSRPPCRSHLLPVILELSTDPDETVRGAAITTVKNNLFSPSTARGCRGLCGGET